MDEYYGYYDGGVDIDGSGGDSYIVGTDGNDRLHGGWNDPYASDTVIGGGGDDKIAGGKGDQADDVLSGGSGADTFYFGSYGDDDGYYQGFGTDTITDFNPWEGDRINVVAVHDVNKASWGDERPYDSFDVYNDGVNTYVDVYANAGDSAGDHGLAGRIVLQNIVIGAEDLVENYVIAWPNPEYADF